MIRNGPTHFSGGRDEAIRGMDLFSNVTFSQPSCNSILARWRIFLKTKFVTTATDALVAFEKTGVKLVVLLLTIGSFVQAQSSSPKYFVMPGLFSDNMVLQQKSDVPVWGRAKPNEEVKVKSSWGQKVKTRVKPDSVWEVHLKTVKAGGPYELSITVGDSTIVYENVMLGEVWLCSGQSNMEEPLEGWPPTSLIQNSDEEIKEANYPDIRLFNVEKTYSVEPVSNCGGSWTECSPATAAKFSAVAYFFGRKLYNELHVPIGLINSSWGGTAIQSWISGNYLAQLPFYTQWVKQVESGSSLVANQMSWIRSHPVIDVPIKTPEHWWDEIDFGDRKCSEKNYNDSIWKTMKIPEFWISGYELHAGKFNGAVWFRKNIIIPKTWIDSTLVLDLGPIDPMDETFVNGVKVGGMFKDGFFGIPRVYDVPGEIVKDTTLTIAIRVTNINEYGGLWGGYALKMQVHPKLDSTETVPLSGEWKYMPVAEYVANKYYVYGADGEVFSRPILPFLYGEYTPTSLYNGMIAPIIPYMIKGVIWDQGEANSGYPNDYKDLLSLLIKNWRTDWGEGNFPFYWVQIAPWGGYGKSGKSYLVRDAQRLTLSVPNTGMAVTLDFGTVYDPHAPQKQDFGLRLALWALAKNYGKHVIYSGPLYKSMKVKNGKAIISFKYDDDGLVFKPLNGESNFIIAGRDSDFVKADVKIVGKTLVVYSPKVKNPEAVRYTWGNTEGATLFNKAGLPASTFRTDNWAQ